MLGNTRLICHMRLVGITSHFIRMFDNKVRHRPQILSMSSHLCSNIDYKKVARDDRSQGGVAHFPAPRPPAASRG